MRTRLRSAVGILLAVASLSAGCGGSGSSATPAGPGLSSASTTIPLSGGQAVPLPDLQGYSSTVTVPANDAPTGASVEVDETLGLPSGVAAFDVARAAHSLRPSSAVPAGSTALISFSFVTPVTVTLQGLPSLRVTLPHPQPAASYGVALYSPDAGWSVLGALAINGSTLTFTSAAQPFKLTANVRYTILFYQAPAASPSPVPTSSPTVAPTTTPTIAPTSSPTIAPTATPTIAPTATPTIAPTATPTIAPTATPTPLPVLTFSTSALQFNSPNQSQNFTLVTGPGTCCATYTASTSNGGVVTVAQTGNGTWTATSTGPGSATITLSTPGYQPYTIAVDVAQLILVPQSRGGHR